MHLCLMMFDPVLPADEVLGTATIVTTAIGFAESNRHAVAVTIALAVSFDILTCCWVVDPHVAPWGQ